MHVRQAVKVVGAGVGLTAIALAWIAIAPRVPLGAAQQSVSVRVNRWVKVEELAGNVRLKSQAILKPARVGDRLQRVGDELSTGEGAKVKLVVDTGIGAIFVDENTTLRVRSLGIAPDNGRITRLTVSQGQVRLRLRKFTHQGSQLDIETPAGLSGVRGTEFGLAVQPGGKTAVATQRGGVATSARNREVLVRAGTQNFTIPGEVPTKAVPLTNSTELQYRIDKLVTANERKVRVVGRVDPVNTVRVEGTTLATDRHGQFDILLPAPSRLKIQVEVVTPLGKRQTYDLPLL